MQFKYYLTFKPRGGSMTFRGWVTGGGAVLQHSLHNKGSTMKPTTEQIEAEITALKKLVTDLPAARNNLRITIAALEDRMTHNQVYDQYDSEDTQFSYALDAAQWLAGDSDTKPSEGWD